MTAPLEAGLIAAAVVLFAGFAAAMVARVVGDRRPMPSLRPVPRWVPGPDAPTVTISRELAQAAAAEGERLRLARAAKDAQWAGVR